MSDSPAQGRVTIGWLYPSALGTYGDRGNMLALVKRAEWRGLWARVIRIEALDDIPRDVDILFLGGGQDRAQARIAQSLDRSHGAAIRARLDGGAALLAICGGYQLLCREYVTLAGQRIPGVGIFDAVTRASGHRMVGDVRVTTEWGTVVGFENHSGRTYLGPDAVPLGRADLGHGNNGEDGTEGVVRGRALGSYLHGPLLPRNPRVTDWLLLEGLRRREPAALLSPLPDDTERATRAPFAATEPIARSGFRKRAGHPQRAA